MKTNCYRKPFIISSFNDIFRATALSSFPDTPNPNPQTLNTSISTMGRFLKPDNIVPNAINPQSWNLYSYVNGNPVNFNDPFGHSCQANIPAPSFMVQTSGADRVNWGALAGFYNNLYGGNVAFGGAGGTAGGSSQSGYWQSVYDTTMTTSDTVVWSDEFQAWVGGDVTVTATQVGIVWVEYGGGSGTSSNSAAAGALRELARVFIKESFNLGNRWPFWGGTYLFTRKSCQDYAFNLQEKIFKENLQYWKPKVYESVFCYFGSEKPFMPAHYSVVLEPINGNPFSPVWIDFYTVPTIRFWAYPSEWQFGPVRYSFGSY